MDEQILKLTEELMVIKEELIQAGIKKSELEETKRKKEYELYNKMENSEVQSFNHEKFGTIFRSHRVFCKIEDIEKASKFLKEMGVYDDVMQVKASRGRLNKVIKKEYIDKTEAVPEVEIGISYTVFPMICNRGNKQNNGGDTQDGDGEADF